MANHGDIQPALSTCLQTMNWEHRNNSWPDVLPDHASMTVILIKIQTQVCQATFFIT